MHILVVGGGSAGHVIPAIPVIRRLLDVGAKVSFVGTYTGLEERLVADLPIDYYSIHAGKLRRYWSWQNVTDVFRILVGLCQALLLMLRTKPDVIFSKGGFVSFPVVFAGWITRVPIVAHESDLTPGLANKLVLPFADTLCLSFADTKVSGRFTKNLKIIHSGTPIRDSILAGNAQLGRQRLTQYLPGSRTSNKPLLIVTGGSLGATFLNEAVRAALPQLLVEFDVLHVCGAGKLVDTRDSGYAQVEYIDEGWGDLLAAADIVLSRAGANALFELLALGQVNLLVPLPALASRGDQIDNAAYAFDAGYSEVLAEAELTTQSLLVTLQKLQDHQTEYKKRLAEFVVPNAAETIANELIARANAV